MSKSDTRPQELPKTKLWEVKLIVPWIVIMIMASGITGLITGWNLRSGEVITHSEVKAQILEELALKNTKK